MNYSRLSLLLIVSVMLTFAISACDTLFPNMEGSDDEFPDSQGEIRMYSLLEGRTVDFGIGDRMVFSDAAFKEMTDYEKVSVGQRLTNLLDSETGDTLFSERTNFIEFDRRYNMYAFEDDADSLILRAVENDDIVDPEGRSRIRIFNAFKHSPTLDVYFTNGDDIEDAIPAFVEVDFNNNPQQELVRYEPIDPGDATMTLTESGTTDIVYQADVDLEAETSFTVLLLEGDEDGTPSDHTLLEDN